jgi:hypothetical protein
MVNGRFSPDPRPHVIVFNIVGVFWPQRSDLTNEKKINIKCETTVPNITRAVKQQKTSSSLE